MSALTTPRIFDADGDGRDDLIFDPPYRENVGSSSSVVTLRGISPQPWRRLGNDWQPGGDYDGDGWSDVVSRTIQHAEDRSIAKLSGRTGIEIDRDPVDDRTWAGANVRPLAADLDDDGVHDVLTIDSSRGSDAETPFLRAYSGRTGRSLWQRAFEAGNTTRSYHLEARDLDGDRKLELIVVAEMSFSENGVPPSWTEQPVWLVVLDSQTGAVRWKRALSRRQFQGHLWDDADASPLSLAFADFDGDGVVDIVAPTWPAERETDGWPIDLEFLSGKTGEPLRSAYRTAERMTHELVLRAVRVPTLAAEDLDADGQPEVYCLDVVDDPVSDMSVAKTKYRLSRVEFGDSTPRWSVDFRSPIPEDNDASMRHRPRPVAVSLGNGKRGIAVWSWGMYQKPGEVLLYDAAGKELWKSEVHSPDAGVSLRVVAHDLTGDGADELIFVNADVIERFPGGTTGAFGVAVEAHNVAKKQLLWRTSLPTGINLGRAYLFGVRPSVEGVPATVEVLADRALVGLSGDDGRKFWECNGLPQPYQGALSQFGILRHRDPRTPPRILWRTADDVLCRAAMPTEGSPFRADRLEPRLQRGPDPRFRYVLPWQRDFGWPYDSPLWLGLGLVFAVAWLIAPVAAVSRLITRRDRRALATIGMVVALALAVLIIPTPDDAPMNPLRARWTTAWMMLPIAAAVLFFSYEFQARRFRSLSLALIAGSIMAVLIGFAFIAIQRRVTPADEHWRWDASFVWPFLLSSYLASILVVLVFVGWRGLNRLRTSRRLSSAVPL